MIRLLVVDDEPINLRIIQECLEEEGYVLTLLESGKEALDVLEQNSPDYTAIILDRLMPDIDGIEILKKIKQNPRFQDTPVILQTALGENEHIVEGLQAGAFYYLTKPYSKKLLISITNHAIDTYKKLSKAKKELASTKEIAEFFREGRFQIQTFSDAIKISPVLSNAFPNPRKALIGILELLVNAIEHGNLEIGCQEKRQLLSENKYNAYIEQRLKTQPYRDRFVDIHLVREQWKTRITITDQGKGFDHQNQLDWNTISRNIFQLSGRGILIAKSSCFDKMEYIGNGSQVIAESYVH